jgi:hypothetical protein
MHKQLKRKAQGSRLSDLLFVHFVNSNLHESNLSEI